MRAPPPRPPPGRQTPSPCTAMKYPRLLLLALWPLGACAPAAAQRAAVFGVYDPDSFIEGNAGRLVGCHNGHRFIVAECARLADTISTGEALPGLDSAGRFARVRVGEIRALTGDLYEAPYTAEVALEGGGAAAGPVLFWRPGPTLQAVTPEAVSLDSAAARAMRAEGMRLYAAAEQLRAAGDRAEGLELGAPVALRVEGHDQLVVHWPAQLVYGAERDRRASLFFVYDPAAGRVVEGGFGHPEWAPVERDAAMAVQPVLFFRVGGDRRVYFLARQQGPWEHIGFGIYELRTGRQVLGMR